jgi:hypothetical protein
LKPTRGLGGQDVRNKYSGLRIEPEIHVEKLLMVLGRKPRHVAYLNIPGLGSSSKIFKKTSKHSDCLDFNNLTYVTYVLQN